MELPLCRTKSPLPASASQALEALGLLGDLYAPFVRASNFHPTELSFLPMDLEKSEKLAGRCNSAMNDNITCTVVDKERVICNGTMYDLPEGRLTYKDNQFWIYLGIYTGLVIIAGMMSGLTMGLLSLDITTLRTIEQAGSDKDRRYARRILPLVKRHHLLLVTLLLGNAAAVEAMPIFLDRISDPIIAIVVSVTAVLIFGEVIPQAVCTRFGLAIGAALSPVVYVLMGLLFIVAWPLSKLLDCLLGEDHGTFFRRAQLKALVNLHGPEAGSPTASLGAERLSADEVSIILGAIDMKNKTVRDAMVTMDKVKMLSSSDKMDSMTMTSILQQGHSRVPVYEGQKNNIIKLLLTKTLIKLDPDDAVPVVDLLRNPQYCRDVIFVPPTMPLFDLLNLFQTGRGHLAVVKERGRGSQTQLTASGPHLGANTSDSTPLLQGIEVEEQPAEEETVLGVITLEDVLEELLQEEIYDETDRITLERQVQVAKAKAAKALKVKRCLSQPGAMSSVQAPQSPPRRDDDDDEMLLAVPQVRPVGGSLPQLHG